MIILEDTRQKETKHTKKHEYFKTANIFWNRTALYCGDYTLPTNQSICIDTKKDMQELIGDIQVKKMPKNEILKSVSDICEDNSISLDLIDVIYHAIVDDDSERFAEKEINEICYLNNIPESVISDFQKLYVDRHGFFHRGLKRAQNSKIKLIVLVENKEGIKTLDDVQNWINPRSLITIPDKNNISHYTPAGRPIYARKPKYPKCTTGNRLFKAMNTMQTKYGVTFLFCTPEEAGKEIIRLLSDKE